MNARDKYGILNPNNASVNSTMYECLDVLPEASADRIANDLQHLWVKDQGIAQHTFHELLLGAHLARHGLRVAYSDPWKGKTPDWSVFNLDGSRMGLVEVSNHHLDKEQADAMEQAFARGEVGIAYPDNVPRLYRRFADKAAKYSALVIQEKMPYVIAAFGTFETAVTMDEIMASLTESVENQPAIFPTRIEVSGAYYFGESGWQRAYNFIYVANPHALHPIALPSDTWHYGSVAA